MSSTTLIGTLKITNLYFDSTRLLQGKIFIQQCPRHTPHKPPSGQIGAEDAHRNVWGGKIEAWAPAVCRESAPHFPNPY